MPRAGLTPDLLTRSAADLADAEGLAAVTMSAVARRFGVRAASLYGHVTDAGDLHDRIALLALAEMATTTTAAIAGRSGRDALEAYADSYRAYARDHPGRYAAAHRRLDRATALASEGPRHTDLSTVILRGYGVPDQDVVHAVRLLGASIHGFIDLETTGAFDHSEPAPEVSWNRLVDGLDHLLRHWPASSINSPHAYHPPHISPTLRR